MKSKIKIGLFIAGLLFSLGVANANAKTLTIDEVINKFNDQNLESIGGEWCTGKLTLVKDESSKKLYGNCGGNNIFDFSYTNEYIDYEEPMNEVYSEGNTNNNENLIINYYGELEKFINGITESIFVLSGYENMSIDYNADCNYDNNGFELDGIIATETAELKNTVRSLGAIDYKYLMAVQKFKISLNTDKIDSLISKYGDPYIRKLLTLTPTVEIKDITNNSVILLPKINYNIPDSNYKQYFYLYECNKDNKNDCHAIDYNNSPSFTVSNLENNTKYYYKVVLMGSSLYSDIIEVTTKDGSLVPNPEPEKKNPETGAFIPISFIALLVSSTAVLLYTKNKNILK